MAEIRKLQKFGCKTSWDGG